MTQPSSARVPYVIFKRTGQQSRQLNDVSPRPCGVNRPARADDRLLPALLEPFRLSHQLRIIDHILSGARSRMVLR